MSGDRNLGKALQPEQITGEKVRLWSHGEVMVYSHDDVRSIDIGAH